MKDCLNCEKYNALAAENEKILDKYNLLKIKYDKYNNICLDCVMLGFMIGVVVAFLIVVLI